MNDTPTAPSSTGTKPRLVLPPLSCDAHCHIMGPGARFPYVPGKEPPADGTKEMLFALHRRLGIQRSVLVQSAVHGTDNSAIEDAIAAGGGRYLGIAVVPIDVAPAELRRLADAGFRGVRFNFMRHLAQAASVEEVVAFTPALKAVGMHLQVHFESSLIHSMAPVLKRSVVPVVIDHMGRNPADLGPETADFQALLEAMRDERFHMKVSGVDRASRAWPYADGVVLAKTLVDAYPDRCVWGTDWNHPNHHHVPDDAALVDLLADIAPERDTLEKLMVSNPERLYEFKKETTT